MRFRQLLRDLAVEHDNLVHRIEELSEALRNAAPCHSSLTSPGSPLKLVGAWDVKLSIDATECVTDPERILNLRKQPDANVEHVSRSSVESLDTPWMPAAIGKRTSRSNLSDTPTTPATLSSRGSKVTFAEVPAERSVQKHMPEQTSDSCAKTNGGHGQSATKPGQIRYEVLPAWINKKPEATPTDRVRSRNMLLRSRNTSASSADIWAEEDDTPRPKRSHGAYAYGLKCLMLDPHSLKRSVWELLGAILIFYDLVDLPLMWYQIPDNLLRTIMTYIALCYWPLDIIVSFLTGVDLGEGVSYNILKISFHYLKTWLIFDIAIVAVDWTIFIVTSQLDADTPGHHRTVRIVKLLRLLRTVRALRTLSIFKFEEIKAILEECLISERAYAQASVSKMIACIVVLNHFFACFFYGIGIASDEGWVAAHFAQVPDSIANRYVTSYHWAICQLGLGEAEVQIITIEERIYSIFYVLCALALFSSVVSASTNSLAQIQQATHRDNREMTIFNHFCRQHSIPLGLRRRAIRFIRVEYQQLTKQIAAQDVNLLKKLSAPLHESFMVLFYLSELNGNPLIENLSRSEVDPSMRTMRAISRDSLSSAEYGSQDDIFHAGEQAQVTYYVVNGELNYLMPMFLQLSSSDKETNVAIKHGSWIAEEALWTFWEHLGDLQAISETRMVLVNVKSFGKAVVAHSALEVLKLVHTYANDFVAFVNKRANQCTKDLSETQPFNVLSDVMDCSMVKPAFGADVSSSFCTNETGSSSRSGPGRKWMAMWHSPMTTPDRSLSAAA